MLSHEKKICNELHAENIAESSLTDAKQHIFKQIPLPNLFKQSSNHVPLIM